MLDVVRNVDNRFATIPNRQARGIAGLSEGAFGALNISLHHLGTFSVAESWSGYFNELPSGPFSHEPLSVIRFNSPEQYVRVAAPLIHRLGYRAWIYQGTVDRNPAFHIRDMSQRLHAAGATVHYGFFPGGHDWGLWRAQLPRMLIAASDWFHTNPRATSLLTSVGHQGSPAAIRRAVAAPARQVPAPPRQQHRARPPARARLLTVGRHHAVPRCAGPTTSRSRLAALLLVLVASPQAGAAARCYGAASRDAEHPCFNRAAAEGGLARGRSRRCWRPRRRATRSTARGRSACAGSGSRRRRDRRPSR